MSELDNQAPRLLTDYSYDQLDLETYRVRLVDDNGATLAQGEPFSIALDLRTPERRRLIEAEVQKLRALEQ
jgi:hypothetical protein